jgi:hypothetical protein
VRPNKAVFFPRTAPTDYQRKPAESERVARFTALQEASEYRFDEVERLRQQGSGMAVQVLSKCLEEEIDGKFQPLIDAAIGAERLNASLAQEKRSRWSANPVGSHFFPHRSGYCPAHVGRFAAARRQETHRSR